MNGSIMTLPDLLEASSVKYGHRPAFAFVGEKGFTYSEFRIRVYALIAWLEKMGIKRGDRVAILSTNMPNWPLVYFAVTSMECIVVPILHDFSDEEIENVLLHSETETIFVSSTLEKKLKDNRAGLKNIINIEDFSVIRSHREVEAFSETATPAEVYSSNPDDLAAIIYTSGTTGKSKGVMLTHMNVCSNADAGKKIQEINENDRFLSVLPLSHTFENTIGMLIPVMSGSAVYYLTKPPTAPVLLPALREIRPTLMLAVPLIIEKIYFSSVRPKLTGSAFLKTLYGIAPFRKVLHRAAGKKLMETFGGE
ncbi:MAG: AMP-binding protein, partial [Bacteroidales bacterium]